MIPFDFEYYKPTSAQEAVSLFHNLRSQEKNPMYYGGGTEIISFSRLYQLFPKAVIDVKGIPECNVLEFKNDKLVIGAAKTLSQVQESNLFPLLNQCGGRVADHTIRDKITLGGNICSRIPFREAILALLVSDCEVIIENKNGIRKVPLESIYTESMLLEPGDLLLQFTVEKNYTVMPFFSMKKTADGDVDYPQDRIGYPLLSGVFLNNKGHIRAAFSGLCPYPFRSLKLEAVLNDTTVSPDEKLNESVQCLPAPILNDMDSSAQYREFVFRNTLAGALDNFEGVEF